MIQKSLSISVCLFWSAAIFADDSWILQKNAEGILVYTRPVSGTPYSEFRAVTRIKTSLFSVLSLWADPSTYTEWMFNCKEASLLKQESKTAIYAYIVSEVPWPLMNRDDILFADTTQDSVTGKITIELTGKPNYIPQKKDLVRVVKATGRVEIIPLGGGEIELIFQFFMNPGGLIPAPIINLTVIDFPFFTFKKLREVVKKPRYQEASYEFFQNSM